jgi:hypothetical protein
MRLNRLAQPLALATLLFAGIGGVNAQTVGLNWNPRTGDVWVDTQLADINRYGTTYREPFIDEMVRYHGAPRDYVTDLLVNQRWSAGDVYYACTIAQVIGRPCRYVAEQWQQNRGQGWGVVAQRLGIKPGSAEFHRLKKGFVPTYDRWSRPIVLDADLKRAYPNHGKGKGAASASKQPAAKARPPAAKGKPTAEPSSKPKGPPAGKGGNGSKDGKGNGQGKGNGKP